LEQEAATVLRWKYQAAEDRQGSRQFDPAGLAQFEAALRRVEEQLAGGDLAGARRAMAAVGRQFEQHRAEVEKRRGLWLTRKQASEAALARLQERIAGLQADQVLQRWEAPAVAGISERASELSKVIEGGQFEHATREADKLLAEAERVLKAAEEQQSNQEKTDFIAERTVAALQACGFTLDGISQSAQGASGNVRIQVHNLDGRALAVSVQEGRIEWSVDGFPMHVETGSNGQPAAVCDAAVEQIEAIQDRLNKDYGVETCALTWAGQDPSRPRKTTKPGSHRRPQSSQRTHQARLR
jgi:multidrug efflux pump subunit AcrB